MFEQVAGRSNSMRRCLAVKGCIATRFDSVCNVCFTASPFSEGPNYRNFGSWIVGSRACRVKHNRTWTAFIS